MLACETERKKAPQGISIWQLHAPGTRYPSELNDLNACDDVAGKKSLEGKFKGLPLAVAADVAAVAE